MRVCTVVVVVVGGELEAEEGVGGEHRGECVVEGERRGGLGVEGERGEDLREAVGGEQEEEVLEDEAAVDRVAEGVEIRGSHHHVGEGSPAGPEIGELGDGGKEGGGRSLVVLPLPYAPQHVGAEGVALVGFEPSAQLRFDCCNQEVLWILGVLRIPQLAFTLDSGRTLYTESA